MRRSRGIAVEMAPESKPRNMKPGGSIFDAIGVVKVSRKLDIRLTRQNSYMFVLFRIANEIYHEAILTCSSFAFLS